MMTWWFSLVQYFGSLPKMSLCKRPFWGSSCGMLSPRISFWGYCPKQLNALISQQSPKPPAKHQNSSLSEQTGQSGRHCRMNIGTLWNISCIPWMSLGTTNSMFFWETSSESILESWHARAPCCTSCGRTWSNSTASEGSPSIRARTQSAAVPHEKVEPAAEQRPWLGKNPSLVMMNDLSRSKSYKLVRDSQGDGRSTN